MPYTQLQLLAVFVLTDEAQEGAAMKINSEVDYKAKIEYNCHQAGSFILKTIQFRK